MSWTHKHGWTLQGEPERVFRALTEGRELERWFAERVEAGRKPGGPYRFWGRHTPGTPAEHEARQTITRFEPGRALGFSWLLHGADTEVTLTLEPGDGGTRLTIEHRVDGDIGLPRQQELVDDFWRFSIGNLMAHLAGGDGIVRPDFADPSPEVRLAITIDAPPEVVFRALIEPERINRWFGSQSAVVEPLRGGRYDLNWTYRVDGRDVTGGPTRILEIEPNRKLVLDWPDWRGDELVSGQTISFLLEPKGKGTRVTFVHAGFLRVNDISDYPFGWSWFLGELTKEAERPDG